jgi:DNA-binding NarL/FixJ family response regulator
VTKSAGGVILIDAIHRALAGDLVISPCIKARLATRRRDRDPLNPTASLSAREQQVFLLIGQGCSTREIAARLHISVKTVETFRWRIKMKLGIEKTSHFVVAAADWADHQGLCPSVVGG